MVCKFSLIRVIFCSPYERLDHIRGMFRAYKLPLGMEMIELYETIYYNDCDRCRFTLICDGAE